MTMNVKMTIYSKKKMEQLSGLKSEGGAEVF